MIRTMISALAATSALASAAAAQDIAVQNATLWTGDAVVENATVVIRNGQVVAASQTVSVPAGIETIDAQGKWVTPGIFAAYTQVGIVEVGAEDSTNDTTAPTTKYSAALDMSDAFNPSATSIPITRLEGVTRIAVAPGLGASLFKGQGFVADTSGEGDSITQDKAFMSVNLGEGAAGVSGGSRAAAWTTLRAALIDARTYPARFIANNEGDALNRVDAQALAPASRGSQLMLIEVSRASDIRQVIALKEESPSLNIALVGAQEAWIVADELAAAEIPVIIDPFDNLPDRFESLGSTQHNAERLFEAGVETAIAHIGSSSQQARLILQSAGNAVANGVSREDALRAITSTPASIFGMTAYGHLQTGSAGDLVIWDGDPLEVMSAPTDLFIDGERQSLTSRQTELRDRYISLDESERPLAYKH